jgi:hypothetical protein
MLKSGNFVVWFGTTQALRCSLSCHRSRACGFLARQSETFPAGINFRFSRSLPYCRNLVTL